MIKELPQDNVGRKQILTQVRQCYPSLPPSETTTRVEALLAEADGKIKRAIEIMENAVHTMENEPKNNKSERDLYFRKCHLGRLYRAAGQPRAAVNLLHGPASNDAFGGEARYELALAYSQNKESDEAAIWLKRAIEARRYWGAVARDEVELRENEDVARILADIGAGGNSLFGQ